jgi:DNA-directed RNA polymerase subunit RPC12/RpoP
MKMDIKCPGQDMRHLTVGLYKCPSCGHEVEIFSDELRVKCPACGEKVYRERTPSCIEWCSKARECLGEERWKELKGN